MFIKVQLCLIEKEAKKEAQKSKSFVNQLVRRVNCGPTWARTRDPLIMSQML